VQDFGQEKAESLENDLAQATRRVLPYLEPTSVNNALTEGFRDVRRDLIERYIAGVAIGHRKVVNLDVVHSSSAIASFTCHFDERRVSKSPFRCNSNKSSL
jgi:3'-phosphoadenosine 5'-phosphosulfate sulfotransferase